MKARNESLFGVADFYSRGFNELGHKASEIYINNEILQKKWAIEHNFMISQLEQTKSVIFLKIIQNIKNVLRNIKWCRNLKKKFIKQKKISKPIPPAWAVQILQEQIKQYDPDIIVNQAMEHLNGELLGSIKNYAKLIAGQIAAPLPKGENYYGYDIVFSSLPNFVQEFRKLGIKSELNRLAFESTILDLFSCKENVIDVAFIGGITADHRDRLKLVETLCKEVGLKVWGRTDKLFLKFHAPYLFKNINGPLWGRDMYSTLNKAKVVVNQHIDIAGNFANNMRLYEATGMGCLLITDWKENIPELFEPDKEIVTYRTPEECVDKIKYYLNNEEERKKIALAGQKRTLSEHNYRNRVSEMLKIIEENL